MERLKTVAIGVLAGAVVLAFVGFKFFGWETAGGVAKHVKNAKEVGQIEALTPVCADLFMKSPDAAVALAELKAKQSYERNKLIEDRVKIPGVNNLGSRYDLIGECGAELVKK